MEPIINLLLAFCLAATVARGSYVLTPAEERLTQWIIEEGGMLKAEIGMTPEGVRGVFATEDIPKGETVISIPAHLALTARMAPAADDATFLLKELHAPCTRLQPYLDALPKEGEVLSGYNFPIEYVKYLADPHLEELVVDSFQRHAKQTFEGNMTEQLIMTVGEAVGRKEISLDHWLHVVTLMDTRTFIIRKGTLSMVPFLDLMNHDPRDYNKVVNTPSTEIRLIAGKDLVKGEEITITYGDYRSDMLLAYYGFIDRITNPPRLLAVDHREFKPYENKKLTAEPLTGPPEALSSELARLRRVLSSFESRLAALGPVPDQPHPWLAAELRELHRQRRTALRNEVARIEELLGGREEL